MNSVSTPYTTQHRFTQKFLQKSSRRRELMKTHISDTHMLLSGSAACCRCLRKTQILGKKRLVSSSSENHTLCFRRKKSQQVILLMLQKASQEMTMFFVREEGITISYTFSKKHGVLSRKWCPQLRIFGNIQYCKMSVKTSESKDFSSKCQYLSGFLTFYSNFPGKIHL